MFVVIKQATHFQCGIRFGSYATQNNLMKPICIALECINEPNSKMYNIPVCCELLKNIDIDRFMIAAEKVFKVRRTLFSAP